MGSILRSSKMGVLPERELSESFVLEACYCGCERAGKNGIILSDRVLETISRYSFQ